MRWLADKMRGAKEESELSSGMLFSTGLVAGGSIAGLLVAALLSIDAGWARSLASGAGSIGTELHIFGIIGDGATWSALFFFLILCTILVRRALRRLEL